MFMHYGKGEVFFEFDKGDPKYKHKECLEGFLKIINNKISSKYLYSKCSFKIVKNKINNKYLFECKDYNDTFNCANCIDENIEIKELIKKDKKIRKLKIKIIYFEASFFDKDILKKKINININSKGELAIDLMLLDSLKSNIGNLKKFNFYDMANDKMLFSKQFLIERISCIKKAIKEDSIMNFQAYVKREYNSLIDTYNSLI